MLDLNYEALVCKRMLDDLNIPYRKVDSFTINTRAANRWGQCKRNNDETFTININIRLLESEKTLVGLRSTILHELLHTCPGCMNHGTQWKSYAAKVYNKYGIRISTTDSYLNKGISQEEQVEYKKSTAKYKVVCKKCGYTIYKTKKCDLVNYPGNFSHRNCGGTFICYINN